MLSLLAGNLFSTPELRENTEKIYIQPNGYKVEMRKHPGAPSRRLIGTNPEGTFCHKPCTVSGGGKSEIGTRFHRKLPLDEFVCHPVDAVLTQRRHVHNLSRFLDLDNYSDEAERLDIQQKLLQARAKLEFVQSPEYLESLVGTIGADPLRPARAESQSEQTGTRRVA